MRKNLKYKLLCETLCLRALVAIFFCFFLTISAFSQSDSLYKYLEIAARNNPAVLQRFAEYQAAIQKIPQAGSLPDPQLSVGVFLRPMMLLNGNQVADIRLIQMFPWFGVLKFGKDEMSLMAKSKYELFRDAKLQLFYDVRSKWYELNKIEKNIYYSEKSIEILKTIENLAVTKLKTGNIPGNGSDSPSTSNTYLSDVYRIQIESGDLENNIASLKSLKQTITAQFNSFLNRPPLSIIYIPENILPDSLGISTITILDSLQSDNPMLDKISFEKQSFEARKKMVSRMGFPMIGIGLNYSLINKTDLPLGPISMNGKDMMMPMVTVTLPVYRKKYNAMISEASFQEKAALYNYQEIVNNLQTEYYQAIQSYEDARRRIKLYDNQFILASKSLEIVLNSYSSSTSDLTEVLRARQQIYDYELKQVEALTDFNIAIAWLRKLGNK